MTTGIITILITAVTFLIMLLGFALRRNRRVHIALMSLVIVYDVLFPFYLFSSRDWYKRLIVNEDILTFGVWMHLGGVVLLYVLYVVQIQAARNMMTDAADVESRVNHRKQGIGLLFTRGYVLLTGAMLYDPQYAL